MDAEIEEILEEDKAEKAAGFISVLKLFKMRSLRWQVISIIVLMAGQQLSGVNAVGSRCWGWGWSSAWTTAGAGHTPRRPGRGLAGLTSVSFQIYYYADQIYLSAGVNEDDVQFVTVGTGAVNVLITVCAVSIPGAKSPSATRDGGYLGGWAGGLSPERSRDLGGNVPLGPFISNFWAILR